MTLLSYNKFNEKHVSVKESKAYEYIRKSTRSKKSKSQ